MSAAVARAALQLLDGGHEDALTLSGGEPFLFPSLVHRVLSWTRGREGGPVECTVLTNGTRVRARDLALLAEHDVGLRVSLDGAPSAQARRGPGTHEAVVRLLGEALEQHPRWAERRLSVAMVVQAETLPTLARSVEGLLEMGVREILVRPLLTRDPGWTPSTGERLEKQVDQVAAAAWRHAGAGGRPAVDFLRTPAPLAPRRPGARDALCSASSRESVAVDPDGRAWGCPSFMASLQRMPPLARSVAGHLELGNVLDPDFGRRLADLPRRAGRLLLLRGRDRRWSQRGPCRECPFFDECSVCPYATTHIPGNDNPHRVPDHQCDFQYAAGRARQRMKAPPAPAPRRYSELPASVG
jgi:sulfatase maturation enzyme AslB (radical SAM superfamily)